MLHGVIMAGGRGERFWPYGRRDRPKQFLPLFGDVSLLQKTVRRLDPLIPLERLWIVTTEQYADSVAEQLPGLPTDHIIVEPEGRNTAPCIALALAHLRHRAGLAPDAVTAVLPADHWIGDEGAFRALLDDAGRVAFEHRCLVTLGIEPTAPETGYGYIELGRRVGEAPGGHDYYRVSRFVEKPPRDKAEAMLARGGYLWNSGMFVWRLDAVEAAYEQHLPDIARHVPRLATGAAEDVYRHLTRVSVDVGIMEKADDVCVLPAAMGWRDVGSWSALGALLEEDDAGNRVRGADVVTLDSRGCIVFGQGTGPGPAHVVAAIGLDDVVIVRTPEATLVCARDRVQDVREIVRLLEERGREDVL